jgi:hypothetical protein
VVAACRSGVTGVLFPNAGGHGGHRVVEGVLAATTATGPQQTEDDTEREHSEKKSDVQHGHGLPFYEKKWS